MNVLNIEEVVPGTFLLCAFQWTWTLENQWMSWCRCCGGNVHGRTPSSCHRESKGLKFILKTKVSNLISYKRKCKHSTANSCYVPTQHILSFEENAEAFIHRRLVLSSVDLAFLQRLDGAELSREPPKQGLSHVEGLKHSLVKRPQLPVDLDLRTESTRTTIRI